MILQSHPSDAHAWVVVSAPGCVLAIPASEAERFDEVAARLAGDDGFRAALELLIAGGIAAAPSFALLDGDSTVARVVLRGEATVIVTATDPDAAELTVSGVGVSTWSERVLEGARSLRLQVPGSTWTVQLETSPRAAVPLPAPTMTPAITAVPASEPGASTIADVPSAVAEATLVPSSQIEVPTAVPATATVPPPPAAVSVEAPAAAQAESEPESAFAYDFLFGDTIYRTQAGVSVRIPNPDPERPGDHDGRTMLAEELGLRGHLPAAPVFPELPTGDVVPAAFDATPDAHDVAEATILAPIPGHLTAAPAAGRSEILPPTPTLQLERADGVRESLSRPVLIGRAPTVPRGTASATSPRLVTIADDKDISRNHVRIAVEGDAVVVTDLTSKNGTVITLPGGSPRKLRGGEPAVVLPGTLIDLGGGVTFVVRED